MLALAMAFLCRPRLLMIDELSLGLAPVVVAQLLPLVDAMRADGTTVILVEQSVNVALTVADTAFFMEKGEIRFRGPTRTSWNARTSYGRCSSKGRPPVSRVASTSVTSTAIAPTRSTPASHQCSRPASCPCRSGASVRWMTCRSWFDPVRSSASSGRTAPEDDVVRCDLRVHQPDAGVVLLVGDDVSSRGPAARASRGLGRSSKTPRCFSSPHVVEECIGVACERWIDVRDPVSAALRLPNAYDSERKISARVAELIGLLALGDYRSKFVRELSTGTRRVVDLACLLAHRPAVILLDEPSSGIAQRRRKRSCRCSNGSATKRFEPRGDRTRHAARAVDLRSHRRHGSRVRHRRRRP